MEILMDRNIYQALDEILETGNCILSEDELYSLTRHRDPLIRGDCCYASTFYRKEFAKKCLLLLINDRNADVRSDAADCLDLFSGDVDVRNALLRVYKSDKSTIVRGYAGYSLLAVSQNAPCIGEFVKESLKEEHYYFVKLLCYDGLLRFFGENVLDEILNCFRAKKYQTRCATANVLGQLIQEGFLKDEDMLKISLVLEKNLLKEDVPAVRSSVKALVEKMNSFH